MERNDRIYVPPKRGPLPWRYQERPLFNRKQQLRLASILLVMCAAMAGLCYLVLR
jgi:Tfp pilus assembly protein PilN